MSSSLNKYVLSLVVCCIIVNIVVFLKVEHITKDIIIGVNLFYFIPITFAYILYIFYTIAIRKNPSWSRVFCCLFFDTLYLLI